jgi:hypothetical protein
MKITIEDHEYITKFTQELIDTKEHLESEESIKAFVWSVFNMGRISMYHDQANEKVNSVSIPT